MSDSVRSVPDWVIALAHKAQVTDGAPPFSDQAYVDYRLGQKDLIAIGDKAAALASEVSAEFVVEPAARGRGLGNQMLEDLLSRGLHVFWAHGDLPASRKLAEKWGLRRERDLLHFVGTVDANAGATSSQVDSFRLGVDEDEWIALNAKTFFFHPEQGDVTRADLDELEREPWFSADDFLILRRDGKMIGYCWLKVEGDSGEFYVVGVDPDFQGEHLGAVLFDAGLARIAGLGIRKAHLYVEADNAPALGLYTSRGFERDAIDVQYSVTGPSRASGTEEG